MIWRWGFFAETRSAGKEIQELRVKGSVHCHHFVVTTCAVWVARLYCSRLFLCHLYLHGELLVVLAVLPLPRLTLVAAKSPHTLWTLRSLGQKNLGFYFFISFPFGSWLLFALRSVPALIEPNWSLIKLGLAFIGRLSSNFHGSIVGLLISFLIKEQWWLDLYLFFDGVVGPVILSLLIDRISSPVRGGNSVEVRLSGISRFVELVYHISIKLFT